MLQFILTVTDTGDRDFLEKLFDTHSGRMYRAAYKILENKQDAEDAVQDAFVKIYRNIDKFTSLSGDDLILLIVIYTRNTARDILRRRNTALRHSAPETVDDDGEPLFEDIADPGADTLEIVVNRETVREVAALIDALPEPQRDVIVLKYRYGMKEREIAGALCISETAVSSRILRAKASLRKSIGELFGK